MRLRVSPGSCRIKPALFLGRRSYEATKPGFRFLCLLPPPRRICNRRCLFVCLSFVCLFANRQTLRKDFRTDLHEIFREDQVGNGPMNKWLNFGGDLDHRLDTGIVFRIRHYWYWEVRKVVSTDCAAQRCSARHALAGIAIAK